MLTAKPVAASYDRLTTGSCIFWYNLTSKMVGFDWHYFMIRLVFPSVKRMNKERVDCLAHLECRLRSVQGKASNSQNSGCVPAQSK